MSIMKRYLCGLLGGLLMLFAGVSTTAAADEVPALVMDQAGLLSESEIARLTERLTALHTERQFDLVFVTVDSLNGKESQDFADDYYDENGYGVGDEHDGALFLLAMEERQYYLSTCGFGITAITDYGREKAVQQILPSLKNGRYYAAFTKLTELCDRYVALAQAGTPVDVPTVPADPDNESSPSQSDDNEDFDNSGDFEDEDPYQDLSPDRDALEEWSGHILLSLCVGMGIALIVVLVWRSKLKSVRFHDNANTYVRAGSLSLTEERDDFLYSHTDRRARPKQEDHSSSHHDFSSGGGSDTHVASSGATHGGGGGSF